MRINRFSERIIMNEDKQHDKTVKIIVNAEPITWNEEKISYTQVVDLAFPPPHGNTEVFTVQFSKGPEGHPKGTLVEGQSVKVKNDMVFNVQKTDKS